MTLEEEQDLRSLAGDLAAAANSPWEPQCTARAFASPTRATIALTMQAWIDLEAMRSPLLRLETPAEAQDLERAARAFALSLEGMSPEDGARVWGALRQAVMEAFSLAMPMQPPGETRDRGKDGFGAWLPLFAFLVTECGIAPGMARALRVDQAFALLAACRRNQGWECVADSYAERDVLQETAATTKL